LLLTGRGAQRKEGTPSPQARESVGARSLDKHA